MCPLLDMPNLSSTAVTAGTTVAVIQDLSWLEFGLFVFALCLKKLLSFTELWYSKHSGNYLINVLHIVFWLFVFYNVSTFTGKNTHSWVNNPLLPHEHQSSALVLYFHVCLKWNCYINGNNYIWGHNNFMTKAIGQATLNYFRINI